MVKPLLSSTSIDGVDPGQGPYRLAVDDLVTDTEINEPSDWNYLVDPSNRSRPEATACHGITDEDVRDHPPFTAYATEIYETIRDCDLIASI